MNLQRLWTMIEADFTRALKTFPDSAMSTEHVCLYQEYIKHNELELACDQLENYAKEQVVPKEFWIALGGAATKMQLFERANRYGQVVST
jgi:hypothetical protein